MHTIQFSSKSLQPTTHITAHIVSLHCLKFLFHYNFLSLFFESLDLLIRDKYYFEIIRLSQPTVHKATTSTI